MIASIKNLLPTLGWLKVNDSVGQRFKEVKTVGQIFITNTEVKIKDYYWFIFCVII